MQLRVLITYHANGDKAPEVKRTYFRFDEKDQVVDGFLPKTPSSKVPDPDSRFFSDVVENSLVECYYSSIEPVADVMVMASVYCMQTHGVDGSGAGAYVEIGATCGLTPGDKGGGRTYFTVFDAQRMAAASAFNINLMCETFDHPGKAPTAAAAVARTPRAIAGRDRPSRPQPTASPASRVGGSLRGTIVSASNDETFIIETTSGRHVFKAKTYCFGISDGASVVFVDSPSVCVTNTFVTSSNSCEVWCE